MKLSLYYVNLFFSTASPFLAIPTYRQLHAFCGEANYSNPGRG